MNVIHKDMTDILNSVHVLPVLCIYHEWNSYSVIWQKQLLHLD